MLSLFSRPAQLALRSRSAVSCLSSATSHAHHPVTEKRDVAEMRVKVSAFMNDYVFKYEKEMLNDSYTSDDKWTKEHPRMIEMQAAAKKAGLFNLFLPEVSGLTNEEYASLAEIMGNSLVGSEAFNCQAPDTGNMELLHMFATEEQSKQWLDPILAGEMKSCFAMTEPYVASSDATNMESSVVEDGDNLVLNGRKWFISNAGHPNCHICIFMCVDPKADEKGLSRHERHSMILVPMNTPGVEIIRPLSTFGYEDAPHGHMEMQFTDVVVPKSAVLGKIGGGFAMAQARLGPGRIHHCMRLIGMAERSLTLACERTENRIAFGKKLSEQGVVRDQIARCRIKIDQARLLTLMAAAKIDAVGAKNAKKEIGMIKIVAPQMAQDVIDVCMQIHGGGGLSQDYVMAHMFSTARWLRLADGPDEVHVNAVGKQEIIDQRLKREASV